MASFILADNPELTAREALEESKRIMEGHKFDLFVLQLSFLWWYLLGAITFGIAYVYVRQYKRGCKKTGSLSNVGVFTLRVFFGTNHSYGWCHSFCSKVEYVL